MNDKQVQLALQLFVFFGAALLFAVQPIAGTSLLPAYGGGVHVWATSLMVFQGLLFFGYLYAHLVAPRIGRAHLVIVGVAIVFLPLSISGHPSPDAPVATLIGDVFRSVAAPFFVLATTSVTAQAWLARSTLPGAGDPYFLYGRSNAGSLIGLLGYPLLVQPLVGLSSQKLGWSALYGVYAIIAFVVVFALHRRGDFGRTVPAAPKPAEGSAGMTPLAEGTTAGPGRMLLWLVLSAIPSALLLAVTNIIAADVGSIPLVWALPLALYLLSFILIFARTPFYPTILRRFWPHLAALGIFMSVGGAFPNPWVNVIAHLCALFFMCMAGHAELHRLRPETHQLTTFYLLISLGGWIGGVLIAIVAPMVLTSYLEYGLAIMALAITIFASRPRAPLEWMRSQPHVLTLASIVYFAILVMRIATAPSQLPGAKFVDTLRNHYGIYKVVDVPYEAGETIRYLIHGSTIHGAQVISTEKPIALTYYHPNGPMADALRIRRWDKVAIVGLGAGAIASFFEPEQDLVFYELDGDDEIIARKHFDYLTDRPGLKVVVGDARISLEREEATIDKRYDLMILDAFSSDSIPTHLITMEAMRLYRRLLNPDGVLLFHITNRYYDLRPVLRAAGKSLGLSTAWRIKMTDLADHEIATIWYALVPTPEALTPLLEKGWLRDDDQPSHLAPWTDDRANHFTAFRLHTIEQESDMDQ